MLLGRDVGLVQFKLILSIFKAFFPSYCAGFVFLDSIRDVLSHLHATGVISRVQLERITVTVVSLYNLYLGVRIGNVLGKVFIPLETLQCLIYFILSLFGYAWVTETLAGAQGYGIPQLLLKLCDILLSLCSTLRIMISLGIPLVLAVLLWSHTRIRRLGRLLLLSLDLGHLFGRLVAGLDGCIQHDLLTILA